MATYIIDNIRLRNSIINNNDPTKQLLLSLDNITSGNIRTLSVPDTDDTIIGANTTQTLINKTIDATQNTIINIGNSSVTTGINVSKLANGSITNTEFQLLNGITSSVASISDVQSLTNKTITDTSNSVSASSLRTTTNSIDVSSSTVPSAGYILTANSSTAATWQAPSLFDVTFNNLGVVTTSAIASLKQWYGHMTSASGVATFNVTSDGTSTGTAIFSNLSSAYIFPSSKVNSTSNTVVPYCSIQAVTNSGKSVAVNVKTGNTGTILIGGTYTGIQNAADGTDCYLYIIGT